MIKWDPLSSETGLDDPDPIVKEVADADWSLVTKVGDSHRIYIYRRDEQYLIVFCDRGWEISEPAFGISLCDNWADVLDVLTRGAAFVRLDAVNPWEMSSSPVVHIGGIASLHTNDC
jgi:hypothetical protein